LAFVREELGQGWAPRHTFEGASLGIQARHGRKPVVVA
jgi:hypothetical protein